MVATAPISFVKPPVPFSYTHEFTEMWGRVFYPTQTPLRVKGSINVNGLTGLINREHLYREFTTLFSMNLQKPEFGENSFYVPITTSPNVESIPIVVKIIEWILKKFAFWIPSVGDAFTHTRDIFLPSILIQGETIQFRYDNLPVELTLEGDYTTALETLKKGVEEKRKNPHLSPYLLYSEVPDNVLVINERKLTPHAEIYKTSDGKKTRLTKQDCDGLQCSVTNLPFTDLTYDQRDSTLFIDFSLPDRPGYELSVSIVRDGDFLFVCSNDIHYRRAEILDIKKYGVDACKFTAVHASIDNKMQFSLTFRPSPEIPSRTES